MMTGRFFVSVGTKSSTMVAPTILWRAQEDHSDPQLAPEVPKKWVSRAGR